MLSPSLQFVREELAFVRGEDATGQHSMALPDLEVDPTLLWLRADIEFYYGRIGKARELFSRAAESARAAHLSQSAERFADDARQQAEIGDPVRACKSAQEALALSTDAWVRIDAATALALSGSLNEAGEVTETLNQQFPSHTLVQAYGVPTIKAVIQMAEKKPREGIDLLTKSKTYEMGGWASLYPAYLRGLAYMQAGDGQNAAVEFQKLLDHPGVVEVDVTGALAHLQLGRAQVMMGDKVAARKSYNDFLTLWKDADPDIPIYKQAKAEYAKLQ
jgi:tetratricopeptide (TPR) repeat protein